MHLQYQTFRDPRHLVKYALITEKRRKKEDEVDEVGWAVTLRC